MKALLAVSPHKVHYISKIGLPLCGRSIAFCHNLSLMGETNRCDVGHQLKHVRITLGFMLVHWIGRERG